MKNINIEVLFIDENENIVKKDKNLIEKIYFKIIQKYIKYIDANIIK